MNNKHSKNDCSKSFQELLELILENPFMSYLDYDSVRADLFETEDTYIVEVELVGYHPHHIHVSVELQTLLLVATKQVSYEQYDDKRHTSQKALREEKIEKTIDFPFLLTNKKIVGTLQNSILEITIYKNSNVTSSTAYVPIHPFFSE
ncbi:Hsp20 family protein [Priestia flexa]|uniref:Hsp20/alpha crystallin family protein n=1 Tax=Priestia flexa TaxID=86664 RepID=UPI00209DFB1C|nr:Hsp20 family protein [Priestia flexa]MCP1189260.1 Hsp20 family protein [Priestia flexa]